MTGGLPVATAEPTGLTAARTYCRSMTVPVRYYCPRCGAIVTLQRDAALADKSVTPYPLEGWQYAAPDGDVEAKDGVRFVCGEDGDFEDGGCGEPFYLNYVRFDRGEEIDPGPDRDGEQVDLAIGPGTRSPRGPRGPSGPSGR